MDGCPLGLGLVVEDEFSCGYTCTMQYIPACIQMVHNYSERSEVSTRTRSRFVWLLCEFLKHRSW